jgi:hypothetical protein
MSPAPVSSNRRSNSNDTQIACDQEFEEMNKDEQQAKLEEAIPLKPIHPVRTASYEDEEAEKIRRIFVTGLSCI